VRQCGAGGLIVNTLSIGLPGHRAGRNSPRPTSRQEGSIGAPPRSARSDTSRSSGGYDSAPICVSQKLGRRIVDGEHRGGSVRHTAAWPFRNSSNGSWQRAAEGGGVSITVATAHGAADSIANHKLTGRRAVAAVARTSLYTQYPLQFRSRQQRLHQNFKNWRKYQEAVTLAT
jgi:hypothetical protein